MVLVQKWPFFQLFFLGNIGQENVFYDILERNNGFLGQKNKQFKSRKIDVFPKSLTHGIGPKMASFRTFFLGNIGQGNVFYDIVDRKTPFQARKTRSSKGRKIDVFPKGLTHAIGPKMAIFLIFFFLAKRGQENVFYDILEARNAFLGYKNKNFKKSKN